MLQIKSKQAVHWKQSTGWMEICGCNGNLVTDLQVENLKTVYYGIQGPNFIQEQLNKLLQKGYLSRSFSGSRYTPFLANSCFLQNRLRVIPSRDLWAASIKRHCIAFPSLTLLGKSERQINNRKTLRELYTEDCDIGLSHRFLLSKILNF